MKTQEYSKDINTAIIFDLYRRMQKIRLVEEEIRNICLQGGMIKSSPHLYHGQEAVASGVCSNLTTSDYLFSNHRSHGHYIASDGDLGKLFAELFGKKNGCSAGKGGSMHLYDKNVGYMGSSSIVGGAVPIAVGVALAVKYKKQQNVVVVFLGDGAIEEGSTYESLNLAALKKLPILFVVENNGYAILSHLKTRQKNNNIYKRFEHIGVPGIRIDGNNSLDVYSKTNYLLANIRSGSGPFLLECITYRILGHAGPNPDDEIGYRTKDEVDSWVDKCPIKHLESYMLEKNIYDERNKQVLLDELNKLINISLSYAHKSAIPGIDDLLSDVMSIRKIIL